MYQSPLCLLLKICGVLCICLGIEHRAVDVQGRNGHARQNACDVKLAAVDQIHHDAQDAEYSHDCAPYDEPACFFTAFAVLDAFDSGDQLANPSDQCQKQRCPVGKCQTRCCAESCRQRTQSADKHTRYDGKYSGNDHQNASDLQKLVSIHNKSSSLPCCLLFYSAGRLAPHSAQNTLLPFGIPHSGHFHPPSGAGLEKIPASVSPANATRRVKMLCALSPQ